MTVLRWVVVGCGAFGLEHLGVLRAAGEDVVAVVDPDPERRNRAATLVDAIATDELDHALTYEPDVVIVATPEHLHVDPVVRALGVADVLVEKPLASTAADADAIVTAAAASGRLLFVGHLLRFDPRLRALRGLIEAGRLGEVAHIACRRVGLRSLVTTYQRIEPLVLSGVHDADIVAWLSGRRATRVSAVSSRLLGLANPEHQVALLELEGGASAVIEAGWLLPSGADRTPHVTLEVVGTDATARLTDDATLTVLDADGVHEVDAGDATAWSPTAVLSAQCDHVVAHVQSREPSPVIGPEVGIASLRTMLAASLAAASGQSVRVTS